MLLSFSQFLSVPLDSFPLVSSFSNVARTCSAAHSSLSTKTKLVKEAEIGSCLVNCVWSARKVGNSIVPF